MGVLSEIFSYGNGLKRKVNNLLADPAGTIGLGVTRFDEDQNALLNLMSNAYPMAGEKTVLNRPQQIAQFRQQLADKATEQAMAGMFVGKGSKTWDAVSAQKAEQLAAQGVDPRAIWSETGTWKGPDGMWRQEIPDNAARLHEPSMRTLQVMQESNPLKTNKVSDVLSHRQAYNAYPDLQDIGLQLEPGKGGSYSGRAPLMGDPESITVQTGYKPDSTIIHELQHAIQERSGFAEGGALNSREIQPEVKRIYDDAIGQFHGSPDELMNMARLNAYRRLAGEAEARATQARMPLDAAQRRALFPEDSYDVPLNQLIIRGMTK